MDKRAAIRDYKLSHRPMGVFQIRNTINGKVLVDASVNVPGKMNRLRFQLNAGAHPSRALQTDWKTLGCEAFEFEVLEQLEPREQAGYDHASDVAVLLELWLEKLQPYSDAGYNEKEISREERLRRIAARRTTAE